MSLVPAYRRKASTLHSARPVLGALYCAALTLPALLFENPLVLVAALAAIATAAIGAGVATELRGVALLSLPLALLVLLINPLVSQQGQTLLVRGWEVLGRRFDVTLEALAYGGIAALRVVVLVLGFALYSATVNPDGMLRALRRVSYRSALTASLATRLVPVLARDATRMSDAARCRPSGRARAALGGALERAVDLAASLELRGYASVERPPRERLRWSRHDVRIAAAAAALAALLVATRAAGVASFDAYPELTLAAGPAEVALCAALLALAAAPLAGARARLGVARA